LGGTALFDWQAESQVGRSPPCGLARASVAASIKPTVAAARTSRTMLLVGIETLLGIFADGGFEIAVELVGALFDHERCSLRFV
jgi:hypothetical protein